MKIFENKSEMTVQRPEFNYECQIGQITMISSMAFRTDINVFS